MKKFILSVIFFLSTFSFSQTCNLLNHACTNTSGLNTSGISANAGSTIACTLGNYVLYSSTTGHSHIATDDLLVNQGNAVTLHFDAKKSSTYTGTPEIWVHVGGYCNFNVYTTPFNTNGWVLIGTFNPTTTCAQYGPFTVPSDIIGGNMISYCIVLKNASATNWVSIEDICVSQIAGSAVPTTYNETFGTSASGWYPQAGYVGVPYHTYKSASDAYVILGTGQGGGSDKGAYFYTGFDFCSTVSGTGIVTKEINTSSYTNGEVRISFKSRYPCSGTLSYTFDEDYTNYSPEVYIMEGPDDGSNVWVQLPVNYYFADYSWRVASYDISAYKNSNVRIKVERGGFCGTAMEAVDNIKVLDRNCAISLLSCGTITGELAPLENTNYNYTVPSVVGATYYKWFVRSQGNLYEASPYIVSGQGTQNVTINFGTLPSTGLRVLCIPYDANPGVVADACYAEIGYLGVTLTTSDPLTIDNIFTSNGTCYGANDGGIIVSASGGTPPYSYDWLPNVSSSSVASSLPPGSYQITVTDSDLNQVVQTVVITEPTELIVSGFSDQVICNGDVYTPALLISGGTGPSNYSWSPATNVSNALILNPDFYPTATATYTLMVSDANGCLAMGQFEIQVNQPPTPVMSAGTASGCAPLLVNFTNLTIGSSSCEFIFGDGNTLNSCTGVSNIYLNSGLYDVTLNVTGSNGCIGSTTYNDIIAVSASPIFDLGGPYTICDGQTQLLDAGAGILLYDWSTGETSQTISVNAADTYSVTITNMNGCEATDNAVVNVTSTTLNLGGPFSYCDGGTVLLDAGAGYTAYDWSTTETSQTIIVGTDGIYSVTTTDVNGCVATGDATVTAASTTVDLGGPYTFCDGETILLDAGPGYTSYDWNTTETSQTISVTTSGFFSVSVTDANGCVATGDATTNSVEPPSIFLGADIITCDNFALLDAGSGYDAYLWSTLETTQTITANTSGNFSVEITLGPCTNSDTINVELRDCSQITEQDSDGILVYPNPIDDQLFVQNVPANAEVILFDINGKIIARSNAGSSLITFNTSQIPHGSYVIVVKSDDKIYRWKLIK